MTKKILHLAGCDKFIPPFIAFVKEHFDFEQHEFLLTHGMGAKDLTKSNNVYLAERTLPARIKHYLFAIIKMHKADKIILHGLFDIKLVFLLFCMPWLLKKCYWFIWGGDLYVHKLGKRNWKWKIKEMFRRPVIKRMGHLVTYVKGDVDLAREWYGAKGKYHECIIYLSNLYRELNIPAKLESTINIQIGNSADPTNNHIEVLEKLLSYKDDDICIYVPLSYGNPEHARKVIEQGRDWFGEKFKPLTDFMPFDEYLSFLGKVDIAIFNHKRQQAMGNTITLLGLRKKVYMRSDTTQSELFHSLGVRFFDINNFDSNLLNAEDSYENNEKIKIYFSENNLKQQCAAIFSE